MNAKLLISIFILSSAFLSSVSLADESGTVLTWKTKSGNWKACGPIQCLWSTWKTEQEAIDMVINKQIHIVEGKSYHGSCNRYSVSGVRSYDYSTSKVIGLSEC